jgi:ribosomal protein S18 acetylase RimI-like enzyme
LEEGVSVIAIDKTNDFICGAMLSMMFTRENDSMAPKPTFDDLKEKFNEKHAKIEVLCNDAIHPSDFFESFKDSNKFVDINAIGVHEKYQRKGIASKLVLESMKAGFDNGCDSAIIIATNPNTNNIAKKLNFSHYKSLNWSDYKDSLTGQDWFPAEKLPYTIVNSYYKLLQQSDFS